MQDEATVQEIVRLNVRIKDLEGCVRKLQREKQADAMSLHILSRSLIEQARHASNLWGQMHKCLDRELKHDLAGEEGQDEGR